MIATVLLNTWNLKSKNVNSLQELLLVDLECINYLFSLTINIAYSSLN